MKPKHIMPFSMLSDEPADVVTGIIGIVEHPGSQSGGA